MMERELLCGGWWTLGYVHDFGAITVPSRPSDGKQRQLKDLGGADLQFRIHVPAKKGHHCAIVF
jgi:hypothetical protein